MGISLKDFASFAEGAIERDRELTKEDFEIRNANLAANRDMLIKQKEKKYEKELDNYYAEKEKFDALNSAAADFKDKKINAETYASIYLSNTMPGFKDFTADVQENLVNNFDGATTGYTLKGSVDEINANAAKEQTAINDATAEAIKAAKGDSFLINQILKKKGVDDKKLLSDVEEKVKAAETVELTNQNIDKSLVGLPVKVGGSSSGYARGINLNSKIYKDFATEAAKQKDQLYNKNSDVLDKNNVFFTTSAIESLNIDNVKNYINYSKDGTIESIKGAGQHLFDSSNSSQKMYLSYLDATGPSLYIMLNGDKTMLTGMYRTDKIRGNIKNRFRDYSIAVRDGNVLGKGGKVGNLFAKETNFIAIPTANIIDFDNTLQGIKINGFENRNKVGKAYADVLKELTTTTDGAIDARGQINLQNRLNDEQYGATTGLNLSVKMAVAKKLIAEGVITQDQYNEAFGKIEEKIEKNKTTTSTTTTTTTENDGQTMKVKLPNGQVVTMIDNEESRAEIAKDNSAITDGPKFEIMPNVVQEEKVIDNVTNENVVNQSGEIKKISPDKPNQPVFESREELFKVLPFPMSGKEIKEKYAIDETQIKLNDFTKYSPIQ